MADATPQDTTPAKEEKKSKKDSLKSRSKPQVVVEGMGDVDLSDLVNLDNLDPDYVYRFGHIRPQRQSRLRMKGYVPVDRDEVELLADVGGSEEEKIIHNDVVLMKAPRDAVGKRRREVSELNERRIRAPEGSFKKKAQNTRVGGLPVKVITTEGEED